MDKELCFCIEGSKLYLEQVLVDYNGIPVFFVCRDNASHYVAACTDTEEFEYIVIKVSDADLHGLLHGDISMRGIFTMQDACWEIVSGKGIETDTVSCRDMGSIDGSVLPKQGVCFEILTDEIESYVKKFDGRFLEKK